MPAAINQSRWQDKGTATKQVHEFPYKSGLRPLKQHLQQKFYSDYSAAAGGTQKEPRKQCGQF